MQNSVNYQPSTSMQKAQQAIRHLADGNPPNGVKPEECGEWATLVATLYELYEQGGTGSVQVHLVGEVAQNEELMSFLAGDLFEENPQTESGEESGTVSNGVQVITWADMKNEFQAITWAWEPWLAQSILTLVVGESGAGKSLFTLVGIVKPFLTGSPWPDGTEYTGETGKALWIETEGGQALNLERAETFDLPMDQIVSIKIGETLDLSIDNDKHWKQIVKVAMQDDIKVIVLDSLSGGHTQDENSAAMLKIVKPMAVLARMSGKPVIVTHHLNKLYVAPGEMPSLRHVRGHTSILQTARVIWSVDVPNKFNQSVKRLAIIKTNFGMSVDPLIYTVTDAGIELTAMPQTNSRPTKQEQAAILIQKHLANGPVPSAQMEELLSAQGLLDAAKKVKAELGVISVTIDGVWHWKFDQQD